MDTFSNKREINCCSYHNIFPVCVAVPLAIVLVLVKKVVIVIVLLCMEYMDNLNSGIAVESRGNSRRSTFLESLDLFRVSLLRVEYSKASSMATNSESSSSLGDDWAISSLWDCVSRVTQIAGRNKTTARNVTNQMVKPIALYIDIYIYR